MWVGNLFDTYWWHQLCIGLRTATYPFNNTAAHSISRSTLANNIHTWTNLLNYPYKFLQNSYPLFTMVCEILQPPQQRKSKHFDLSMTAKTTGFFVSMLGISYWFSSSSSRATTSVLIAIPVVCLVENVVNYLYGILTAGKYMQVCISWYKRKYLCFRYFISLFLIWHSFLHLVLVAACSYIRDFKYFRLV